MVMQDLETAVRYDIDVKIVVYNNFSHGTQNCVRLACSTNGISERTSRTRRSLVSPTSSACTGDGLRSVGASPRSREVLDHDGPALLDVLVDPTVWPSTDDIAQI